MSESKALEVTTADRGSAAIETNQVLAGIAGLSDDEWSKRLQGVTQTRDRLTQLYREVMVEDVHYGKIPGTPKPTLYKSGAELLFQLYNCAPEWEFEDHYGDGKARPAFTSKATCRARHIPTGLLIAEGKGSCNTHERKYRYRSADRICPECHMPAVRKSSAQYSKGGDAQYYCWKKKDGCGAEFKKGDVRIESQPETSVIENPDPLDAENTILKMAQKRSHVACALTLGGASHLFAQDLEDLDPSAPTAHDAHKSSGGRSEDPKKKKLNKGQLELVKARAKRRCAALGRDEGDSQVVIADVLASLEIASLEDAVVSQMEEILSRVDRYDTEDAKDGEGA